MLIVIIQLLTDTDARYLSLYIDYMDRSIDCHCTALSLLALFMLNSTAPLLTDPGSQVISGSHGYLHRTRNE